MKKVLLVAVTLGVCLLIGGFVYDVMFAGIPYQDPTPEMQARYDHHAGIAAKTMKSGLFLTVVGAMGLVAVRLIAKKEPIQPPQTTTGSSAPDRV